MRTLEVADRQIRKQIMQKELVVADAGNWHSKTLTFII
jgi:hypothetical protein